MIWQVVIWQVVVVNALTSSNLWKIKFLVEDLITSGGGVIGKDFIVNPFTEDLGGYYNLDDCIEVKSTTNLMRCDNLKFALHLSGKACISILKYSIMSNQQMPDLQIKMLQDNCVVWNAIDYLNFLGSAYNVKCIGMGFDPVNKYVYETLQRSVQLFNKINLHEINDNQTAMAIIETKKVHIEIEEVPQDTTTPGLYFTPTGATYIFTKE